MTTEGVQYHTFSENIRPDSKSKKFEVREKYPINFSELFIRSSE